jgi:hypothetical protein
MHKFSLSLLLSPLFLVTQQLYSADAGGGFNPFDKNKLEFILCAANAECARDLDPIFGHYFTNIDQETHARFRDQLKFDLLDLLVKENEIITTTNRRPKIEGDFFYKTDKIDPASEFTELERLKVCDKDKRFLQFQTFKVTRVNNQPVQQYYQDLEYLPLEDAKDDLMLKPLILTVESCEPNPAGKVASLDLSL